MKTQISSRLIANTLSPRDGDFTAVRRSLGIAPIRSGRAVDRGDKRDPCAIKDRTLDHVVDRLLTELTW